MPNTFKFGDSDECDQWPPPVTCDSSLQPYPSDVTLSHPPKACNEYVVNADTAELTPAAPFASSGLFAARENHGGQALGDLHLHLDQGPMAYDPPTQLVDETCRADAGAFQTFQPGPTPYTDGLTSEDDGEYELDPSVSSSSPLSAPGDDIMEAYRFPETSPVTVTPMPNPPETKQPYNGRRMSAPFRTSSLALDGFNREDYGEYDFVPSASPGQLPNNLHQPGGSLIQPLENMQYEARPTRTLKSKATLRLPGTPLAKPKTPYLKVRIDPLLQQFRYELQVLLTAGLVRVPAIGAAYKATRIVDVDDPRCTNGENARAAHLRTYRGVCRLTSPTDSSVPPCGSGAKNITKHREMAHPVYEFNVAGKPCWVYYLGTVRGKVLHPSEKKLQIMSRDEAIDMVEEQMIERKGWILRLEEVDGGSI